MKPSGATFHRMPVPYWVLVMLSCLDCGPGRPALAQQPSPGNAPQSNAVARGASPDSDSTIRNARISPKWPRYQFVLKPDPDADYSKTDFPRVGSIDVYIENAKPVVQTLDVQSTHSSWITNSFRTVDINMDGCLDLAVTYQRGAKWGSESFWLFDPGSGLFVTNALTGELRELEHNGLKLNPQKKEIRISHFIGICLKSFEVYRIENGHLILLESEFHTPRDPGHCLVEKRRRMNGEMVLVEAKERTHEIPPGLQSP